MAPSFHIENFGCRAARADGEAIAATLCASEIADRPSSEADVVIVNTCSVTAEADREARAWIRRAHRLNPHARIIATGCYAQRAPEEVAALPGVAAVIGNSHKAFAPQIALELAGRHMSGPPQETPPHVVTIQDLLRTGKPLILTDDTFAHSFLAEAPIVPGTQTRPNLKVQEGCSNRCSFCVIPQTRGSSRSLPGSAVIDQIRDFVSTGGNELVVSGINLGRWGRDLAAAQQPIRTLAGLVRAIMDQTQLPRLRLSSIEPMDWDDNLIGVVRNFAGSRLARHAHLPLQSGSDWVLRRMYRRYRPWHYADKVAQLVDAAGPGLTVGADVMAGFPGETDREFQESYDFIRSLPLGYLHLFPFSPRPGTRAWALHTENPVHPGIVNERMAALRALAAEKTRAHRARFVGIELEAITLHTPPAITASGHSSVLTENFLPVNVAAVLSANRLIRIRITGLTLENILIGVPATDRHDRHPSRAGSRCGTDALNRPLNQSLTIG